MRLQRPAAAACFAWLVPRGNGALFLRPSPPSTAHCSLCLSTRSLCALICARRRCCHLSGRFDAFITRPSSLAQAATWLPAARGCRTSLSAAALCRGSLPQFACLSHLPPLVSSAAYRLVSRARYRRNACHRRAAGRANCPFATFIFFAAAGFTGRGGVAVPLRSACGLLDAAFILSDRHSFCSWDCFVPSPMRSYTGVRFSRLYGRHNAAFHTGTGALDGTARGGRCGRNAVLRLCLSTTICCSLLQRYRTYAFCAATLRVFAPLLARQTVPARTHFACLPFIPPAWCRCGRALLPRMRVRGTCLAVGTGSWGGAFSYSFRHFAVSMLPLFHLRAPATTFWCRRRCAGRTLLTRNAAQPRRRHFGARLCAAACALSFMRRTRLAQSGACVLKRTA